MICVFKPSRLRAITVVLASSCCCPAIADRPLSAPPPPPPAWHYGLSGSLESGDGDRPSEGEEAFDGLEFVTERYPNRAVRIRRGVKQDDERNYINHGPWTMYDVNGRVVAQGEFRNGKRHGPWMRILSHFPPAEPEFQGPYQSQAEFADGQLHGMWTITDRQQRVVGSWQFSQGELDGEATVFYAGGQQRQMMNFRGGQPDGEALAWRPDGRVWGRDFYRDGKQLVPVVSWHDRQQKESEGWLLRSNFTIVTHIDWWQGAIEIAREETSGEDLRIGTWRQWYANGSLQFEGSYEQGAPVGEHVWWHENGQKQLAGTFDGGLKEGLWTGWHPNGQKQEEGSYLAGVKEGIWTVWAADGQVLEVQELDHPELGSPERLVQDEVPSYAPVSLDEN